MPQNESERIQQIIQGIRNFEARYESAQFYFGPVEAEQLFTQMLREAREVFVPTGNQGYEVSNTGKVRSSKTGKILKPALVSGYERISLGYGKCMFVHRLVAMAFLANPENKPCVNHIDGNKVNNDVSNLEWATYSENERHSFDNLGKKPWNKGRTGFAASTGKQKVERLQQLKKGTE